MDHGQSLSVVAVRIGSKLMLQLMSLEVCDSAHFQDSILRHCGVPHQVAPGLNVIDILQKTAHIYHCIAHDRKGYVIRYVILVRISEVSLHSMA